MQLVIVIVKEVEDNEEGKLIFNLIKNGLADREDLKITGHVTNHFELNEVPDGS